jgi:hypothetical protein
MKSLAVFALVTCALASEYGTYTKSVTTNVHHGRHGTVVNKQKDVRIRGHRLAETDSEYYDYEHRRYGPYGKSYSHHHNKRMYAEVEQADQPKKEDIKREKIVNKETSKKTPKMEDERKRKRSVSKERTI